jgi:hypothetical protein
MRTGPKSAASPSAGSRCRASCKMPATVTLRVGGKGTFRSVANCRKPVTPVTCHTPSPTGSIGWRFINRSLRLGLSVNTASRMSS